MNDEQKIDIPIKADTETTINTETDTKSKYSIEYLKKIVAASKTSNKVKIQYNQDYPLNLEYKQIDKYVLRFILAPRVEND